MATAKRKRLANGLLFFALLLNCLLFYYGCQVSRNLTAAHNRIADWRAIVAHGPAAVVVVDTCGAIVQWNLRAEALFGWRAEEVIGARMDILLPEAIREKHNDYFCGPATRAFLEQGNVLDVSGYVLRKDGDIFLASIRVSAVCNGRTVYVAQITPADALVYKDFSGTLVPDTEAPPALSTFK